MNSKRFGVIYHFNMISCVSLPCGSLFLFFFVNLVQTHKDVYMCVRKICYIYSRKLRYCAMCNVRLQMQG